MFLAEKFKYLIWKYIVKFFCQLGVNFPFEAERKKIRFMKFAWIVEARQISNGFLTMVIFSKNKTAVMSYGLFFLGNED